MVIGKRYNEVFTNVMRKTRVEPMEWSKLERYRLPLPEVLLDV